MEDGSSVHVNGLASRKLHNNIVVVIFSLSQMLPGHSQSVGLGRGERVDHVNRILREFSKETGGGGSQETIGDGGELGASGFDIEGTDSGFFVFGGNLGDDGTDFVTQGQP